MAKELSVSEMKKRFLDHLWNLINYWENEERQSSSRAKLEGLAHSILAALDGSSMAVPSWLVIPNPHPNDKEYLKSMGEDWFPDTSDVDTEFDIAGNLAYEMFHYTDGEIYVLTELMFPKDCGYEYLAEIAESASISEKEVGERLAKVNKDYDKLDEASLQKAIIDIMVASYKTAYKNHFKALKNQQ